jgi:hypothetical protein
MLKHTLVLGASLKPNRYSNIAIERLRSYSQPVNAIGLVLGTVLDVEIETFDSAFAKMEESKKEDVNALVGRYHTITLYFNPKRQEAYYNYIIALKPKRIIFNPGTENPVFYKLLDENSINYEVACTLVLLATNQY